MKKFARKLILIILGLICLSCDDEILIELQAKIDTDRENNFTSFKFLRQHNPDCPVDASGIIYENSVDVLIPVNTNLSSLTASFEFNGREVIIGETVQESGVTSNDFSDALVYTIRSLDGSAKDYTVVVREASDNAQLASLAVDRGTAGVYEPILEPVFDTGITDYLYWVPNIVSFVTLTAVTVDVNASVKINGTDVDSSGSSNASLADGPNNVNVTVTAEDGLVTRSYEIDVYRAAGIPQTKSAYSARSDDDGAMQQGIVWDEATRFVNQADGTVLDTLTGLLWMEHPYPNQTNGYQWPVVLDNVQDLEAGINFLSDGSARKDWRLPNFNEMYSLFCAADSDPGVWLDNHGFIDYQNTDYSFWTSTTEHGVSTNAYYWYSDYGTTGLKAKISGNPFLNFTAVRGPVQQGVIGIPVTGQTQTYRSGEDDDDGFFQNGLPWPNPRFIDNENGTITDRLTGLIWPRDWDVLSGGSTWSGGLTAVAALEDNGSTLTDGSENGDWRMPNIRELITLTNFGYNGLFNYLNSAGFANVPGEIYWTSTHQGGLSTYVYRFDMDSQLISRTTKGVSLRHIGVRSIE